MEAVTHQIANEVVVSIESAIDNLLLQVGNDGREDLRDIFLGFAANIAILAVNKGNNNLNWTDYCQFADSK